MFNHDLGEELFKTWPEEQRRDEIAKLVEGFRAGLPVGILCKMAETIAGNPAAAREILMSFMTVEEREAAIKQATGGMREIVTAFMR